MSRHGAFLRAVNLGSTRNTPSEELRACFESLGLGDVATFRTSGNVIFSAAPGASEAVLARELEAGLKSAFGFEVPVFLRSAREIRAIAAREPFDPRLVAASKGKLQVSLLVKKPSAAVARRVLGLASDEDLLSIRGRELYWLPRKGYADAALDRRTVDELLGRSTHRTMGTIQNIAAKFF